MRNIEKFFLSGEVTIHSADEMRLIGAQLADCLEPADVLGLVGDLGAGKTHLIQGILQGLGASDVGASPTFALVHEHGDGRIPVAHFDFYRMNTPAEAQGMGWDEYLCSDFALLVEWADRFDGELMPEDTRWLRLKHTGEGTRNLMLAGMSVFSDEASD